LASWGGCGCSGAVVFSVGGAWPLTAVVGVDCDPTCSVPAPEQADTLRRNATDIQKRTAALDI
jgi:hypothetical protein